MAQRKVSYSDLILQILDINLDSFEFNIATQSSSNDLGKGAFGDVKLVREKASGKLFALKRVHI